VLAGGLIPAGRRPLPDYGRVARHPESEPQPLKVGERYGLLTTASIRQCFFSGPFMFEWRKIGRFMAG